MIHSIQPGTIITSIRREVVALSKPFQGWNGRWRVWVVWNGVAKIITIDRFFVRAVRQGVFTSKHRQMVTNRFQERSKAQHDWKYKESFEPHDWRLKIQIDVTGKASFVWS